MPVSNPGSSGARRLAIIISHHPRTILTDKINGDHPPSAKKVEADCVFIASDKCARSNSEVLPDTPGLARSLDNGRLPESTYRSSYGRPMNAGHKRRHPCSLPTETALLTQCLLLSRMFALTAMEEGAETIQLGGASVANHFLPFHTAAHTIGCRGTVSCPILR